MRIGEKSMIIRQETPKDYVAVYQLIKESFASAKHCDGNEQDLVAALRKSTSFVPELSLVAEINGEIAGHILFTEAKITSETVLVLAPLSVLPKFQRQGIGSALIKAGHTIAKEMGYSYCVVLGSETYYPRFGYLPAIQFHIEVPKGIPSSNFMAICLNSQAKPLSGTVTYAKGAVKKV